MVVCVECLPADKPWDVVSVTRRSSGVAPRACVRVYARVLVPPNLYIHTYIPAHAQTIIVDKATIECVILICNFNLPAIHTTLPLART